MIKKEYQNIIGIFIENNNISSINLNLIYTGKSIADKLGYELNLVGFNIDDNFIDYIKGLDCKLINIKHNLLKEYNLKIYGKSLSEVIEYILPKYLFFPSTDISREIATKISSIFDTGMISDAVSYEMDDNGEFLINKPSYGDTAYAKLGYCCRYPRIATFIQSRDINVNNLGRRFFYEEYIPNISENDFGLKPDSIEILDNLKKYENKLENSNIIIAAGLGIGKKENLDLLYELAHRLNAEVGVTRALVEKGWANEEIQIGQTGKIVKPEIYIAFGISGASQHIVGMEESKKIIAVNNNKDANIFKYSDICIVGDVEEILKKLLQG